MKNHLLPQLALLAVLTLAGPLPAQSIAVLKGDPTLEKPYDDLFQALGLKPIPVPAEEEGVRDFLARLSECDVILAEPGLNGTDAAWDFPGWRDGAATDLRRHLEAGALLIVPDATANGARNWLAAIDSSFGGLAGEKCTSTAYNVNGHSENVEPAHPLRVFPNHIAEADSYTHLAEAPLESGWRIIAVCSEGRPIMVARDVGRGAVVATPLALYNPKFLENCLVYARLARAGLKPATLSVTELTVGKIRFSASFAAPVPEGARATWEFTATNGASRAFHLPLGPKLDELEMDLPLRGPTTASLHVELPGGKRLTSFSRKVVLPPLLAVGQNAYRGLLSEKRRFDQVSFPVKLAPAGEDIAGAPIALTVRDERGETVSAASTNAPPDGTAACLWVPVPLPRRLPAGCYTIRAELAKGDVKAESEASFKILATRPAQTIIDEDGVFLVNGVPFFPLGIYHIGQDYARVAEIGFNAAQFWKFNLYFDRYGIPTGLYKASGHGLKCLFESNHFGDGIFRGVVRDHGNHPAILMWYSVDEPLDGAESKLAVYEKSYHESDEQHPVFVMSCRRDLFRLHASYCDVLGFNMYHGMKGMVREIELARAATEGRKALVPLIGAFPSDPKELRRYTYTALTHAINGLFWYCWRQHAGGAPGIGLHEHPDCQEELKLICAEGRAMAPGLTSPYRRTFTCGDVHGMACGMEEGRRFLILMNISEKESSFSAEIPELRGVTSVTLPFASVERTPQGPRYTERAETVANGRIEYMFAPKEERVYRW